MNIFNHGAQLMCCGALGLLFLAPQVMAQDATAEMPRVEVRHHLQLTRACPAAVKQLSHSLERAWANIDTPSESLVAFKLEGNQVTDVKATGGLVDFHAPIQRAVNRLRCDAPDSASYVVRFRIKFVYPEEDEQPLMAMQFGEESLDGKALAMGK
ncbi:MAG: hypothetical protein V4508_03110 [Pseudomonadota bacterium]